MSSEAESRCPACLKPVLQASRGRPRLWCGRGCQSWVQKAGGPLAAAEVKEAFAATWESTGKAWGSGSFARSCRVSAAQCRAEAEALRALPRGTSNTRSGLSGAPERRERGS